MKFIFMLLIFQAQLAFGQTCPGSPPAGVDCVDPAATKSITAFATCAAITNNHSSNKPLMVPTKTSAEWAAFRTKAPAGIKICPCGTQVKVLLTSGTWTVPACWNNSNYKIEAIGGAGGSTVEATSSQHYAAGGGAFARVTSRVFTAGSTVSYVIGAAGGIMSNGGNTTMGVWLLAEGGKGATLSGAGSGGLAINSLGDVTFNGGTGGNTGSSGGGGGGGAAGPNGAGGKGGNGGTSGSGGGGGANGGANGGNGSTGTAGAGGANRLGTGGGTITGNSGSNGGGGAGGGSSGGNGSEDLVWTDTVSGLSYGPCGGGGGGSTNGGTIGGGYGCAGGAGSSSSGSSRPGIIVITYTP